MNINARPWHLHPSIHPFIYLFIYLFNFLFIHSFIHSFIYLFIYLFPFWRTPRILGTVKKTEGVSLKRDYCNVIIRKLLHFYSIFFAILFKFIQYFLQNFTWVCDIRLELYLVHIIFLIVYVLPQMYIKFRDIWLLTIVRNIGPPMRDHLFWATNFGWQKGWSPKTSFTVLSIMFRKEKMLPYN